MPAIPQGDSGDGLGRYPLDLDAVPAAGGLDLATILGSFPIMMLLQGVTEPWVAFALISCALAIVSFYTSISGFWQCCLLKVFLRLT